MVQTMRSGTIIRPGEIQSCAGCHDNRLAAPSAVYKEALGLIRNGQQRLRERPRGDVEEGFIPRMTDQKRMGKYRERAKTEADVRKAIISGRKLYDPDIR